MAATESVADLRDRVAIMELRYRYGRTMDARDWEGFLACFTEDATCTYTGVGSFTGREQIRALAEDYVEANFEYTRHCFLNPILEIDGDSATGSWLVDLTLAYHDGTFDHRHARYRDDYRRVDGEWKVASITADTDAIDRGEYTFYEHEDHGRVPRIH